MTKKAIKEKENIPIWTLIPNQYEWNIYLCLSNKPIDKLIPIFNKHYNLNFTEEQKQNIHSDDCNCTLFNNQNRVAIILLRSYNQECKDYSTLAHEIYHIASLIAQTLQIPMDFNNTTEVWAYFISFYMDICIQTLNEYLKEKTPIKK